MKVLPKQLGSNAVSRKVSLGRFRRTSRNVCVHDFLTPGVAADN